MTWLDPMRRALDARTEPLTVFFRDDDAGWADDRLLALLGRFGEAGLPLDLAVIPAAITMALALRLRHRATSHPARVGLHQHGWVHQNHEPAGRRSEFGPSRPAEAQRLDIETGRRRLEQLFGAALSPIFTPPWNRCTRATGEGLVEAGIQVLSCDVTAPRLALPALQELPVRIDWQRRRRPELPFAAERGAALAAAASEGGPVGVMLHHAVMDRDDDRQLEELLLLLARHPAVRCRTMSAVAGVPAESVA